MCGIAGVFGIENFPEGEAHSVALKMVDAMSHRGPNSKGTWSDNKNLSLGHSRLCIFDTESLEANQPLIDKPSGDALVFNGEIYNFRSLRAELQTSKECNHTFKTTGDSEVLFAALRSWGLDRTLHKLDGMFAFAWWNAAEEKLSLARDRFGIKPLYWSSENEKGAILFASEVRSLLASECIARRVNKNALTDYLRYSTVHAPDTIVKDIKLLEAGCAIEIQDESTDVFRWWNTATEAQKAKRDLSPANDSDAIAKDLRETLTASVEARMQSDVPIGAFLSGGIDSTAIVGLMSEISDKPINTFTVAIDDASLDESQIARQVSEKFQTQHHEIHLTTDDVLEKVPAALAAMDHPSFDGLNTYIVSGATQEAGITVALSGLGSDEIFAGYPVFDRSVQLMKHQWIGSWPRGLRRLVGMSYHTLFPGEGSRKRAEILAGNYFALEHTYPLSRQLFLDADVKQILGSKSLANNAVFEWITDSIRPGTDAFSLPFLSKVSLAELHTYLGHTLLRDTDTFSMAHSLEVRTPFLDHKLVTKVLALPDGLKPPRSESQPPKSLLVKSLEGIVSEDISMREKQGFVLPWDAWLKGPLDQIYSEGIDALASSELIQARALQKILSTSTWSRKWSLSVLGYYIKRHGLR